MSSNHATAFEKAIAQKIKMKADCSEETAINIAQGIIVALKDPVSPSMPSCFTKARGLKERILTSTASRKSFALLKSWATSRILKSHPKES